MIRACTYFDARYMTRGIALYRSLERQSSPFRLWILCLDDESLSILRAIALPHATLVSNAELQAHFPMLREAQGNRSRFEYYATVKAFLLRMIFDRHTDIDSLFFLDADFSFFADPHLLEGELADATVLLSPHRLTPDVRGSKALRHGTYNAGFVAFRRHGGYEPLRWWCDRVLEWCGDELRNGLFADQGYLEGMLTQFPGVRASLHPGINAAPWNLDERTITCEGERLLVNDVPLIFFHFHGLRRLAPFLYDTGTAPYRIRPSSSAIRYLFLPYVRELRSITTLLRKTCQYRTQEGSVRHPSPPILHSPALLFSRLRHRQWLLASR